MTKKTFKERMWQQREAEILHFAATMIQERGAASLNMDDLASLVGISKPTLYQHFSSKDEVVNRAMVYSIEQLEVLLESLSSMRPIEKLEHLLRRVLNREHGPHGAAHVVAPAVVSMHTNDMVAPHRRRVQQKLEDIVIEAQQAGEINPGLPTTVVIGALFSMLMVMDAPQAMETKVNRRAVIDGTIQFFLQGVRP